MAPSNSPASLQSVLQIRMKLIWIRNWAQHFDTRILIPLLSTLKTLQQQKLNCTGYLKKKTYDKFSREKKCSNAPVFSVFL